MKIHIVGDSISIQYGPFLEAYLEGVMEYGRKEGAAEALLNLDESQGANGGDSARVLRYLRARADAGGIDADLLLVNCGLHDIKTDPGTGGKQVALDAYREHLRGIVEVAVRMRLQLVWIRTTPVDETRHNGEGMKFHRFAVDCDAYNEAADEIMAAAGVPLIDLHTFTCNLGKDVFCDHAHFRPHVREKQAAFIAGWLGGSVSVCQDSAAHQLRQECR